MTEQRLLGKCSTTQNESASGACFSTFDSHGIGRMKRSKAQDALLVTAFEGCLYFVGKAVANTYGLWFGFAIILAATYLGYFVYGK